MAEQPQIIVDRKQTHRQRKPAFRFPLFTVGVLVGIGVSQLINATLYFTGAVMLATQQRTQVARPDKLAFDDVFHNANRLLGNATGDICNDSSLADMFAVSTIYIAVSQKKDCNPDVILTVSKAQRTIASFAYDGEEPNLQQLRKFETKVSAELQNLVALIKKHEPELAKQLKNDVQTAVYFN